MSAANTNPKRGPLLVLSGPSGVGKTTVVEALLAANASSIRRAITATTRQPRPGEIPGKDYHFWTVAQFQVALEKSEMLEHAVVHGVDYYGTPRAEVEPFRASGMAVLLVIDVQGAAQVRELCRGDHLSVFLMPPSDAILETRLRGRGSENETKVARRLASARAELARAGEFDHRLVNDDLAKTVAELRKLVESARNA
ncbi:MAG: guanylate kinase [Fimbriiglobus sp.]